MTKEEKVMVALGIIPSGAKVIIDTRVYTYHKGKWMFGIHTDLHSSHQTFITKQYWKSIDQQRR